MKQMLELRVLEYMNTRCPPLPQDLVARGMVSASFSSSIDQVVMTAGVQTATRKRFIRVAHMDPRWAEPGTPERADELVEILYERLRRELP